MTSGKIYAALTTGSVVMAAVLMVATMAPADAQVVRIPQAAPDQVLPAYEVVTIVRSTGLDPLEAPVRYGVTYRLRAVDRAGRDLNVVVDARYGDILLVERAMGGPYPERRRIVGIPPDYDDPRLYDRPPEVYSNTSPYPRAVKPVPAPRVATVPADKRPPLPKPRPETVAVQPAPSAATSPAAAVQTPPAQDAPTKWQDEPAPTPAPAAAAPAAPAAPTVPDVTPLE